MDRPPHTALPEPSLFLHHGIALEHQYSLSSCLLGELQRHSHLLPHQTLWRGKGAASVEEQPTRLGWHRCGCFPGLQGNPFVCLHPLPNKCKTFAQLFCTRWVEPSSDAKVTGQPFFKGAEETSLTPVYTGVMSKYQGVKVQCCLWSSSRHCLCLGIYFLHMSLIFVTHRG